MIDSYILDLFLDHKQYFCESLKGLVTADECFHYRPRLAELRKKAAVENTLKRFVNDAHKT